MTNDELMGRLAYAIDSEAFDALEDGRDQPGTFWWVRRQIAGEKAVKFLTTLRDLGPSEEMVAGAAKCGVGFWTVDTGQDETTPSHEEARGIFTEMLTSLIGSDHVG